mmetsp:Transcript_13650/g.25740  ORF Transcript_13650/g.25740 Transcript_13650/m.25740 type:complete len:301 (-) Transcript_13650:801-1703(-)
MPRPTRLQEQPQQEDEKSFKLYINRMLKRIHPEVGISKAGLASVNTFLNDVFDSLCTESGKIVRAAKKRTLSDNEVQQAIQRVFPSSLASRFLSIIEPVPTPLQKMNRLPLSFFTQDTLIVARNLIGKILEHKVPGGSVMGIINETEAYTENDPGSNTYKGRRSEHNSVMYKEGGHVFIYLSYGIHLIMNITTEVEGRGCGVLLRSLMPYSGNELLLGYSPKRNIEKLLDGPAKLTKALQLKREYYGLNILDPESPLQVHDVGIEPTDLIRTTRIGQSKAGADLEWRFLAKRFSGPNLTA